MSDDGRQGFMAPRWFCKSSIPGLSYLKSSNIKDLNQKCRHICACDLFLTR